MYAEQAHRHLADANFYFFQDKDFFRSRAEGAPLGRQTIGDALCACEASLRPLSSQHQNLGGAERDRTADPLLAKQVLSQLSYSPKPSRSPPKAKSNQKWWARADSNCRPHAYQACALTT